MYNKRFVAPLLLSLLLPLCSLGQKPRPQLSSTGRYQGAVSEETAICHEGCESDEEACCRGRSDSECFIGCAKESFHCKQTCGPQAPPCYKLCFVNRFRCLQDCSDQGHSLNTCLAQCRHFADFNCLLRCNPKRATRSQKTARFFGQGN